MDFQEYALAKDLAGRSADLDEAIKKFIDRVFESLKQPGAEEFGIGFSPVENSPFALIATCHRKIIDIEFENAIFVDPEFRDKNLIAHIKLFVRQDGGERLLLPSPLFLFSGGLVCLLRDFTLNVHDPMLTPHDIKMIRTSLSELILKAVHPFLPVYPDREDIQ